MELPRPPPGISIMLKLMCSGALAGYLERFRSVFPRRETFENMGSYVVGLLSALPRKNGETMAAGIESVSNKMAIHRLMATSPWSAEELDRLRVEHAMSVAATGSDGMLIVDEVSQLKQGTSSVGVKRQYLGCVGKTANGQVAVSVHYCDTRFDWPVTGRLYLPKEWATDEVRRAKAGVPEDVVFQTKGQIALDLVRKALGWGTPADWVLMDAGYGDLDVLRGLERMSIAFCVGVRKHFTVRIPEEVDEDPGCPTVRVDDLVAALPDSAWTAVTYRQGTEGPLTKRFAAVQVFAATQDETGPKVWLLIERSIQDGGEFKYHVVSPRREDISVDEMAQIAHRRPLIERFSYENGKGEVGLRDYQGRSWQGFHHHFALAMLALTWLNLQRQPLPDGGSNGQSSPKQPPPRPRRVAIQLDDRSLNLRLPDPPRRTVPAPRHLWESVQAVRARFLQWCAVDVFQTLTRRGVPLRHPVFVNL